jgi:hypothetical protein
MAPDCNRLAAGSSVKSRSVPLVRATPNGAEMKNAHRRRGRDTQLSPRRFYTLLVRDHDKSPDSSRA